MTGRCLNTQLSTICSWENGNLEGIAGEGLCQVARDRAKIPWLQAALLFLITVALFFPACFNGFIDAYDDELYVTMNGMVQKGVTPEGVRWAFTTLHAANWQPLAWLSHMLDVQLYGLQPFGHHLSSVLVHACSVILLFSLLKRLGLGGLASWSAALLFAIHPQRVESVAWVAERKDVLSVFFGLAALNAYVWYLQRSSLQRYVPVLVLFSLSLMSKPMLVTLPMLMLLMDHLLFDRISNGRWQTVLAEKVPLLLLSAVISALTIAAQKGGQALAPAPLLNRIQLALCASLEYLRMFFIPSGLSFHYPLDTAFIGAGKSCFSALALIIITVWLLSLRGGKTALFGWGWFLLTLLPVSGIIRFGGQFVADRYTYFPHIGLLIILAALLPRAAALVPAGRSAGAAIVMAALIISTGLTLRQIGYWKDGDTLYRRAIELNPGNWRAHSNLGTVLSRQDRYGEAFMHLARAQLLQGYPVVALETLKSSYREGGVSQQELDALKEEIMKTLR